MRVINKNLFSQPVDNDNENEYINPMDAMDAYPQKNPSMTPEEEQVFLENLRLERLMLNDRWQSCLFRDTHCGKWEGSFDLYRPTRDETGLNLELLDSGALNHEARVNSFNSNGVELFFEEITRPETKSQNPIYPQLVHDILKPADFRQTSGNQVVGNTYTFGRLETIEDKSTGIISQRYLKELSIRDGPIRIRCRFLYTNDTTISSNSANTPEDKFDLSLSSFLIIKENLIGVPGVETLALLDETVGPGIYDPQASGSDYCQINLGSKISLLFPRGLRNHHPTPSSSTTGLPKILPKIATLCMLWEGKEYRFQADRKFRLLDGSIQTLELTEITPSNAEKYKIVEKPADS